MGIYNLQNNYAIYIHQSFLTRSFSRPIIFLENFQEAQNYYNTDLQHIKITKGKTFKKNEK